MRTVNGVSVAPEAPVADYFQNAAAVTPSNTVALADLSRGLYVGTSGSLTVIMSGDATQTPVLFSGVPSGTVLKISVSFVMATGTTAGNIVALF